MLKVRTIACPVCATRLRVRSLDAVSDSDACPECGASLKATADQQSADLQATEAAPLHPALVPASNSPWRPGPAGIAAALTGLLGLAIVVPLLVGSPESQSGDDSVPGVASQNPGSQTESPPVSIAAKDGPLKASNVKPATAGADDSPQTEVVVAAPPAPEKVHDSVPAGSEISIVPDGIKVAVASEEPAEKSPIQQASVVTVEPRTPSADAPDKSKTPPAASQPTPTPPASLDERLDVPIAKFALKNLTTLRSVLETVEIMANIQIEASSDVDEAVWERDVAFSLDDTSPRGILNEAASRSGLTVTVSGDRVTLKSADR
ncbi:MAG: hypothetical protein O2820_04405 [Planctomycetota bacterium]|nr:hypothetical protein [Planctomycetota bacterium]